MSLKPFWSTEQVPGQASKLLRNPVSGEKKITTKLISQECVWYLAKNKKDGEKAENKGRKIISPITKRPKESSQETCDLDQ